MVDDMTKTRPHGHDRRPSRSYRQARRAQQAQATGDRIVDTALAVVKTAPRVAAITLDEIARRSNVAVRTVLRRFGSRDGVLEAAFARIKAEFQSHHAPAAPGDVDEALKILLDQYERLGDLNIKALEQEHQLPLLHRALTEARQLHRDRLRTTFGTQLQRFAPAERERRLTALYAATDVYLWKLLRRDLNLDRPQTEATFSRLVQGVLTSPDRIRSQGRHQGVRSI